MKLYLLYYFISINCIFIWFILNLNLYIINIYIKIIIILIISPVFGIFQGSNWKKRPDLELFLNSRTIRGSHEVKLGVVSQFLQHWLFLISYYLNKEKTKSFKCSKTVLRQQHRQHGDIRPSEAKLRFNGNKSQCCW